jgi:hypothetical protein
LAAASTSERLNPSISSVLNLEALLRVTGISATLGQQFLDIAVAQGEAEIEPDRVLDERFATSDRR